MSLLSRVTAPAASSDLAGAVLGALAAATGAPSELPLPSSAPEAAVPPEGQAPPPAPRRLGTSAARPPALPSAGGLATGGRPRALAPAAEPALIPRLPTGPTGVGTSGLRLTIAEEPGGSSLPALYCPAPVRDDPALGEEVNDALVAWAEEVGVYPGKLEQVRSANLGRLIMLAHPDSDDPDRLLAAARCVLAEWATDDHYVDDEELGADPELLATRLLLANSVVDPTYLPLRYAPELEQAAQADPVLVAYRSSLAGLAQYATPTQVARLSHELAVMFLAYNQEGAWRTQRRTPPVWEYLVHRSENSFLPPMVLIDPMGGYELPAAEFTDPAVRRVFTMAGLATVLVNDLASVAKEQSGPDFNTPKLIAAEEHCSLEEAVGRTVELHDELVHTVEAEAAGLALGGSPALARFLAGIWAWMGGNREWHASSPRYNASRQIA